MKWNASKPHRCVFRHHSPEQLCESIESFLYVCGSFHFVRSPDFMQSPQICSFIVICSQTLHKVCWVNSIAAAHVFLLFFFFNKKNSKNTPGGLCWISTILKRCTFRLGHSPSSLHWHLVCRVNIKACRMFACLKSPKVPWQHLLSLSHVRVKNGYLLEVLLT